MLKNKKSFRAYQAFPILVIILLPLSNVISSSKIPPEYYTKKSTWFETMYQSSKRLESYKKKLYNNGAFELGEWYAIGPFTDTEVVLFSHQFPPEQKILLDRMYQERIR